MAPCRSVLLPLLLLVSSTSGSHDALLYQEVAPLNVSESFQRLAQLPLVYYKFLYDSVADRVQLGAIGAELQRLFPEAVEVLPSSTFVRHGVKSGDGKATGKATQSVLVTNFPVVDKNVLFMHGLAALQFIMRQFEQLEQQVRGLNEDEQRYFATLQRQRDLLAAEMSDYHRQLLQLAQTKLQEAEAKALLQTAEEEEAILVERLKKEQQEMLQLLSHQLSRQRLQQEEEMQAQLLQRQEALEEKLARNREALAFQALQETQQWQAEQQLSVQQQRLALEKQKIEAETEARLQEERLSEELAQQKLQLQARLETERMLETLRSVTEQLLFLLQDLLSRPQQLMIAGALLLSLIASFYIIRELSSWLRQFIQQRLGRPSLVRETSFQSPLLSALLPSATSLSAADVTQSLQQLATQYEDIVLSADDKQRVLNLALATRNTKRSNAPYRHVLLHGPPGTGKTLIARRLARTSGMDYAILSGGDVAPLGEDAVNQLHALFRWAQRSARGLLLFIDEAEAFLCARTTLSHHEGSAEHVRNALNALLYQTGSPSRHFMLVLATNRPQDLDAAILDRMDVTLQISLPQAPQRAALIDFYLQQHLQRRCQQGQRSSWLWSWRSSVRYALSPECIDPKNLAYVAAATDGFSGREISKLFISAQYLLFLAPDRLLTWTALKELVDNKVREHQLKKAHFHAM